MTARRLFVLVVAAFVVLVLLALLVTFWHVSEVETMRIVGARDAGGGWYGFWSGFGGSIPDFMILASVVTVYRHHNCHVRGCARLGKTVDGTPYLACPRHHPTHQGDRRGVTAETIHAAHKARRK